jgi:hypothetical protein
MSEPSGQVVDAPHAQGTVSAEVDPVETSPGWKSEMVPHSERVPSIGTLHRHAESIPEPAEPVTEHPGLAPIAYLGLPSSAKVRGPETSFSYYERSKLKGKSPDGIPFSADMSWSPDKPGDMPEEIVFLGLGSSGALARTAVAEQRKLGRRNVLIIGDISTKKVPNDRAALEAYLKGVVTTVMADIRERFGADESYAPIVVGESKGGPSVLEAALEAAAEGHPELFGGPLVLMQPAGFNKQGVSKFVGRMLKAGRSPEQHDFAAFRTIGNIGRLLLRPIKAYKQIKIGLAYNGRQSFEERLVRFGRTLPDGRPSVVIVTGDEDPVFPTEEVAGDLPAGSVMVGKGTHISMATKVGARKLDQAIRYARGEPSTLIPSEVWLAQLQEQAAREAALKAEREEWARIGGPAAVRLATERLALAR